MLFETTIRANIAYGDQQREVPMVDIVAAARQANIHDFITSLHQVGALTITYHHVSSLSTFTITSSRNFTV